MKYLLKTVKNKEDFSRFVRSPFEKSIIVDDYICQKYPVSAKMDTIVKVFPRKYKSSDIVGYINYDNSIIAVKRKFPWRDSIVEMDEKVVKISDLDDLLEKKIADGVLNQIESNIEDIKESTIFKEEYSKVYDKFFDIIVRKELGVKGHVMAASTYDTTLNLVIRNFKNDNFECFMEEAMTDEITTKTISLINLIVESNEVARKVVEDKVYKDAKDYIRAGKYTKEEEDLIRMLAGTKDSGAQRFTVHTKSGGKEMCRNSIRLEDLTFTPTGNAYSIPLSEVSKITYKGKTLYKN